MIFKLYRPNRNYKQPYNIASIVVWFPRLSSNLLDAGTNHDRTPTPRVLEEKGLPSR